MSEFFDARQDCPALKRATRAFVECFLDEVMPDLCLAARGCGYALASHGSKARDIDLIAVPWTSQADSPERLVQRLCGALSAKAGRALSMKDDEDWTEKPHGRRALTIILPGMFPEIDLSIMPRVEKDADE